MRKATKKRIKRKQSRKDAKAAAVEGRGRYDTIFDDEQEDDMYLDLRLMQNI